MVNSDEPIFQLMEELAKERQSEDDWWFKEVQHDFYNIWKKSDENKKLLLELENCRCISFYDSGHSFLIIPETSKYYQEALWIVWYWYKLDWWVALEEDEEIWEFFRKIWIDC